MLLYQSLATKDSPHASFRVSAHCTKWRIQVFIAHLHVRQTSRRRNSILASILSDKLVQSICGSLNCAKGKRTGFRTRTSSPVRDRPWARWVPGNQSRSCSRGPRAAEPVRSVGRCGPSRRCSEPGQRLLCPRNALWWQRPEGGGRWDFVKRHMLTTLAHKKTDPDHPPKKLWNRSRQRSASVMKHWYLSVNRNNSCSHLNNFWSKVRKVNQDYSRKMPTMLYFQFRVSDRGGQDSPSKRPHGCIAWSFWTSQA